MMLHAFLKKFCRTNLNLQSYLGSPECRPKVTLRTTPRGQNETLVGQGCACDLIDGKRKLEWLDAKVSGETEAACFPIHQVKKKRA